MCDLRIADRVASLIDKIIYWRAKRSGKIRIILMDFLMPLVIRRYDAPELNDLRCS